MTQILSSRRNEGAVISDDLNSVLLVYRARKKVSIQSYLPTCGNSPVVQWLGHCASIAGWVRSLVGELRSHKLCGQKIYISFSQKIYISFIPTCAEVQWCLVVSSSAGRSFFECKRSHALFTEINILYLTNNCFI